MKHKSKSHYFSEIGVRLILWCLFLYFNKCEPFLREISENEAWKYKYPVTLSYVPGLYLWLLITALPTMLFGIEYLIYGKIQELWPGLWTITLAYTLNGFVTSFLKVIVGRPRPDFYYRCFPNGQGTDYFDCTGDRHAYLDGRKSFPSGHSSFSFSCMLFISLYVIRRLKRLGWSNKPHSWQLLLYLLPLLLATTVAVSRTCDYHHHYEDVIAGAFLGCLITYLCFKLYFPKTLLMDNSVPPY